MNFISKKIEHFDLNGPQQRHMNRAMICFQFQLSPNDVYKTLTSNIDLLEQWIYNEETSEFTEPIITLYPNISTYTKDHYSTSPMGIPIANVYNLLNNKISVHFQWRSSWLTCAHILLRMGEGVSEWERYLPSLSEWWMCKSIACVSANARN